MLLNRNFMQVLNFLTYIFLNIRCIYLISHLKIEEINHIEAFLSWTLLYMFLGKHTLFNREWYFRINRNLKRPIFIAFIYHLSYLFLFIRNIFHIFSIYKSYFSFKLFYKRNWNIVVHIMQSTFRNIYLTLKSIILAI